MIGDFILWIKKIKNDLIELWDMFIEVFKELNGKDIINGIKLWWTRFICIHDYTKTKQFYGAIYDCKKCGRYKIKERPFWYL
jgi:hypothetical protein